MSHKKHTSTFVSMVVGLAMLTALGCHDPYAGAIKVGREIEPVAKGLEEFGTISMSSPLLTVPGDTFAFDLNRDPEQYYNEARADIHAAAALFSQRAADTQLGFQLRASTRQLLENEAALAQYREELMAFRRKQALQDMAASLDSILPMLDLGEEPTPLDVATALQDSADRLATGVSGPETRPEFPELGGEFPAIAEDVLPATRPAQEVFASQTFRDFMGLLGPEMTLAMPNRAAIITASGDKATEAMLRFLGNPAKADQLKDKVILFGVSMVSVNPGHRTYRGYGGEISVSATFECGAVRPALRGELRDARGQNRLDEVTELLLDWEQEGFARAGEVYQRLMTIPQDVWLQPSGESDRFPIVAAVSPMTETQALDLQSSVRRQKAFALKIALALSGLGAEQQAQLFQDWADRLEQDVASRSAVNVVTAYSNSGGVFGFRVVPRLKALADPASRRTRPDLILEPLSFPALIIMGIDPDDLRLRYRSEDSGLVEPLLKLRQTTRWIPLGNPVADRWPFGRFFDRLGKPRLSEVQRIKWARRLYRAYAAIDRWRSESAEEQGAAEVAEFIRNRIEALDYSVLDAWTSQYLPASIFVAAPLMPQVMWVLPGSIPAGEESEIALVGSDLDAVLTIESLVAGGTANVAHKAKQVIVLTLNADLVDEPTPLAFKLTYQGAAGKECFILTLPVTIRPKPEPQEPDTQTISRTLTDPQQGEKKEVIEFPPTVDAETLRTFLQPTAEQDE